jgi:hypothetical protein
MPSHEFSESKRRAFSEADICVDYSIDTERGGPHVGVKVVLMTMGRENGRDRVNDRVEINYRFNDPEAVDRFIMRLMEARNYAWSGKKPKP